MSDWIFFWKGTNSWAYNHGKAGASWCAPNNQIDQDFGPPQITGVNWLYGDGHVVWHSDFDPVKMQAKAVSGSTDNTLRYITCGGPGGSVQFY